VTSAAIHQPLLTAQDMATLATQASAALSLPVRREVHDHHAGDWPSAWLGRGMDFEEARPYAPGDDVRDMDWRTTARLGHPFIKTYREERQPLLHLVVDRGPGMRFGTRSRLKVTQAARLAVLAGFMATQDNVAVGLTLWSQPDQTLTARHGRASWQTAMQALVAPCPPQTAVAGEAQHDLTRLQTLRTELPRGSRLLLLSDFAWVSTLHEPLLASLAECFDVLAVCISDAAERALPNVGLACFAEPQGGPPRWLDTGKSAVRAAHAADFAERQALLTERLMRCGVRHLPLGAEVDDLLTLVTHHG
jgi:uncharacterized protein (DUF58 family)